MEELFALRRYLEAGDLDAALMLLDEMEEMSRDDKITKAMSYMRVLLVHLIKRAVEQRTTRSWDDSITEALDRTVTVNKRREAGGYYLDESTLVEALAETYPSALRWAAREAFEGTYSVEQLAAMHDREPILAEAFGLIQQAQRDAMQGQTRA